MLMQLQHPNIVGYLGHSFENSNINIFLEYVPGGSITTLLKKYGKFQEGLIRMYTRQILEGLEYLHVNNIVHCDVKGSNVLVDSSGICKLADFGYSRKLFGTEIDIKRQLEGTAHWMAPEVIRQSAYGRFSDIWSLGCTIIEMATGLPPWHEYKNHATALFHIG